MPIRRTLLQPQRVGDLAAPGSTGRPPKVPASSAPQRCRRQHSDRGRTQGERSEHRRSPGRSTSHDERTTELTASSTARRTSTLTRCRRYSALPFVSFGGSVPSSATAPGSAPAAHACLRRARPERRRAHADERDRGLRDAAVRAPRDRGDADRRPVLRAAPELEVAPAVVAGQLRHPHLGHDLLRPDRRLEDAAEEVRRRNGADAVRPGDVDLAVEREHDRRQVRGRIAVRERAADRAAMPHLRIADQPGRVRDERVVLLQQRRRRDVVMARQRADRDRRRPRRERTTAPRAARRRRAATDA